MRGGLGGEAFAGLVDWLRTKCAAPPYGLELPCRAALLPAALADGRALCAVVHACRPGALDYAAAARLPDAHARLRLAFGAAARFGVPELLDAEHLVDGHIDSQSTVTYLAKLRAGLTADEHDAPALRRRAAWRGR